MTVDTKFLATANALFPCRNQSKARSQYEIRRWVHSKIVPDKSVHQCLHSQHRYCNFGSSSRSTQNLSELHCGHRTPSGQRIDRSASILFTSSSKESSNFDAIPISSFSKVSDIGFIAKNYSMLRSPFLDMSEPHISPHPRLSLLKKCSLCFHLDDVVYY